MKLASKPNEAQQSSKEKQRNEQWVKETVLPTQPGACGRGNAKEQVTHTVAGDNTDILENRRALGEESQSHIGLTFFFFFKD